MKPMQADTNHVTLAGSLAGDYAIDEIRDDGRVLLQPLTPAQASNLRLGLTELTAEELAELDAETSGSSDGDERMTAEQATAAGILDVDGQEQAVEEQLDFERGETADLRTALQASLEAVHASVRVAERRLAEATGPPEPAPSQ